METKCIKNVDEETLKKFRDLNEKNSRNFWNEILFGEKLITDKETEEMIKITREIRKERGFRDEPNL